MHFSPIINFAPAAFFTRYVIIYFNGVQFVLLSLDTHSAAGTRKIGSSSVNAPACCVVWRFGSEFPLKHGSAVEHSFDVTINNVVSINLENNINLKWGVLIFRLLLRRLHGVNLEDLLSCRAENPLVCVGCGAGKNKAPKFPHIFCLSLFLCAVLYCLDLYNNLVISPGG